MLCNCQVCLNAVSEEKKITPPSPLLESDNKQACFHECEIHTKLTGLLIHEQHIAPDVAWIPFMCDTYYSVVTLFKTNLSSLSRTHVPPPSKERNNSYRELP